MRSMVTRYGQEVLLYVAANENTSKRYFVYKLVGDTAKTVCTSGGVLIEYDAITGYDIGEQPDGVWCITLASNGEIKRLRSSNSGLAWIEA